MKKLATVLLSSALVGGLTLSALVPAASAADTYRGMQRGNFAGQQQMQQAPGMMQQGQNAAPGQGMRGQGIGPMALGQNVGPQGMGAQGMGPRGQGDLVRFTCSVNGAPRLEIALNNVSENLTLSADQQTLFDALKTSALSAQTTYADACQLPAANAGTPGNPVELLKLRQANDTANAAAIDSVLPSLEAFYNSLTDAQKASLATPVRANFQVGQGQASGQGQFLQRGGQRGMAPGNGQGFGPGNGQGFGPNSQLQAPQNNS